MFGGVRRRNGRGQVYPWFSLFFLSYFFKRKKEERAKYLSIFLISYFIQTLTEHGTEFSLLINSVRSVYLGLDERNMKMSTWLPMFFPFLFLQVWSSWHPFPKLVKLEKKRKRTRKPMKFSEENRDDYKLGSREITFAKFVSRVFLCGEFPRPNRRLQPKIRKEILKNTLMTNQKISNLGSSRPQSLSSFYCGRVGQRLKISVIDWSCVFYSFLF